MSQGSGWAPCRPAAGDPAGQQRQAQAVAVGRVGGGEQEAVEQGGQAGRRASDPFLPTAPSKSPGRPRAETDREELRFFRPHEIWALLKESCTSPLPYGACRRSGYGARLLNWTLFLPGRLHRAGSSARSP